jgi:cobalt/nickel transport protein
MRRAALWVTLIVPLSAGPAAAHFQMLLPAAASGQREQPVTVQYRWGHPFEHQLFDAPTPEAVFALAPDGTRTDLAAALQKVEAAGADGKSVTAFQFAFTPAKRGDHTLVLAAPPIWLDEEKLFLHDTVKVVYHVQTQNGWDTPTGVPFELVPLTRPYGLQPGVVFQAQALAAGKPLARALVEVERYNAAPPKEPLPPDEQITRRVKTDPNGVLTCTLTEPGWWCVTAQRDGGKRERGGQMYPVVQRTTFWVYVDDAPKPAK